MDHASSVEDPRGGRSGVLTCWGMWPRRDSFSLREEILLLELSALVLRLEQKKPFGERLYPTSGKAGHPFQGKTQS